MRVTHLAAGILLTAFAALSTFSSRADDTKEEKKEARPVSLVERVKTAVKDEKKPFTLVVHFKAKEGAEKQVEAAILKVVPATQTEKGCLTYDLYRDLEHPTTFVLHERWSDVSALEAHLATPAITGLLTSLGDSAAEPPQVRILALVSEPKK